MLRESGLWNMHSLAMSSFGLRGDIVEHAKAHAKVVNYCANSAWYGYGTRPMRGFKSHMSAIVGRKASDPRLKGSKAYDVVRYAG